MDELIKQLTAKGLSEDMARTAVTTVTNFLKEKLPAPIAGQVDSILGGAAGAVKNVDLGDVAGKLGGFFK